MFPAYRRRWRPHLPPAQSTTKLRLSGSCKAERVANTNSGDRATPTTRKVSRRPLRMTSIVSLGRTVRACRQPSSGLSAHLFAHPSLWAWAAQVARSQRTRAQPAGIRLPGSEHQSLQRQARPAMQVHSSPPKWPRGIAGHHRCWRCRKGWPRPSLPQLAPRPYA